MKKHEALRDKALPGGLMLYVLTLELIKRIDEMLHNMGEYGEIHLIVQRGNLRYINIVESYKVPSKEDEEEVV
jgi:hypothetical protein